MTCASPLSRITIRNYASRIRTFFTIKGIIFPVMTIFEKFEMIFPDVDVLILENQAFKPNQPARFIYIKNGRCRIEVSESLYIKACRGNKTALMTLLHEMCHYWLLKYFGVELKECPDLEEIKTYCDPEWQAKALAGELMIPYEKTIGMSVLELMDSCKVSYSAAAYRVELDPVPT